MNNNKTKDKKRPINKEKYKRTKTDKKKQPQEPSETPLQEGFIDLVSEQEEASIDEEHPNIPTE